MGGLGWKKREHIAPQNPPPPWLGAASLMSLLGTVGTMFLAPETIWLFPSILEVFWWEEGDASSMEQCPQLVAAEPVLVLVTY